MVVVTVILVVGLATALFKPLDNVIGRLNNVYIKCLLETGELPKVGTAADAVCDAEMPTFDPTQLDGSPVNPSLTSSSENSENKRGESSSADGGSGTDISGSASQAPPGRQSSMIRNGMRGNSARAERPQEKTTNIPVDDFNEGEGFASTNASGNLSGRGKRKSKPIDLSGLTEYDRRKIEKEKSQNRTIAVDSESFTQKARKPLTVKPPPEKKADDSLNVQTDFSVYFKIFFLIVVILFIIILIAGQAMQMKNSSDG